MDDLKLQDYNLIIETSYPESKLTFQWSIRNIQKLPDSMRSSDFSLVPRKPREWCMLVCKLPEDEFQFYLVYNAPKEAVPATVDYVCRILKKEGSFLERDYRKIRVFHGGDRHPLLYKAVKIPEEEETVIFECSMTVRGYGLTTSRDLYNDIAHRDIEKLKTDFLTMKNLPEYDVKIYADKKLFTAHRCVLKVRAPKFFKLHQEEITKGEVVLRGMLPEVFEVVLRTIYCGEVDACSIASIFELILPVAVLYEMRWLEKACLREVFYNLKLDSVCDYYLAGEVYNSEDLIGHCVDFMKDNLGQLELDEKYLRFASTRPRFPRSNRRR